jgi:hypothetical protein
MLDKPVVLQGILASSTAIAALVLVLQGYLLTALTNLPNPSPSNIKAPYRFGLIFSVVAIALSILVAIGATLWLLGANLFLVTIGGFFLSLVLVLGLSAGVLALVLKV